MSQQSKTNKTQHILTLDDLETGNTWHFCLQKKVDGLNNSQIVGGLAELDIFRAQQEGRRCGRGSAAEKLLIYHTSAPLAEAYVSIAAVKLIFNFMHRWSIIT